jgi:hypothetical protein
MGKTVKLHRPYVPMAVRLAVARRQFDETPADKRWINDKALLDLYLATLFGDQYRSVHLDHDPPLFLRERNGDQYTPDANDPNYLVYRTKEDHRIKTFVHGDGAQRSDMAQRRYLKRAAKNRKPKVKFKPRRTKHIRREQPR